MRAIGHTTWGTAIAIAIACSATIAIADPEDAGSGAGSAGSPAPTTSLAPTASPTPPTSPAPPASPVPPASPAPPAAAPPEHRSSYAKPISIASLALIHGVYATWSYFAWYRDAPPGGFFWDHSPAFSVNSYAGGADKLGHFWSNYALSRATTAVLTAGGWKPLPASLVAAGLSEVSFTLTEIQDGYVWGFDTKDWIANVAGGVLAVAMDNVPELDRLFDFRLEYFPSADYRRLVANGPFFQRTQGVDFAQDYSGQSYMLALHLDAVPDFPWARFADLVFGFETRNYSPSPEDPNEVRRQSLYLGVAVNMQHVLRSLFCASTGRRIGERAFEYFSLPYTTAKLTAGSRTWVP